MVDPDKIDYKPCPNCGGKIMYLGTEPALSRDIYPVHTLLCTSCQSMWDIAIKTERLQDAWEDICNKEAQ